MTTAATLWFVTMMGLCFGAGQHGLGLAMLAAGVGVLWLLKWIEKRMSQDRRGILVLTSDPRGPAMGPFASISLTGGFQVRSRSAMTTWAGRQIHRFPAYWTVAKEPGARGLSIRTVPAVFEQLRQHSPASGGCDLETVKTAAGLSGRAGLRGACAELDVAGRAARSSRFRKADDKTRSAARGAFGGDRAAETRDDSLGHGQPQSDAGVSLAASVGRAIERLENVRQVSRRDARSVIVDRKAGPSPHGARSATTIGVPAGLYLAALSKRLSKSCANSAG